ncbi:MAG TPA: DUF2784 domain-containing protein [Pyrinomonadaceae bacterium]|nr:DUF2784 domain-containing protein [Pyrinomonadaceae bacterium]
MWYGLLADLVLAVHVAYVAYILLGLLLILVGLWRGWDWVRSPWFRLTHLAAILIVVLELIFQTNCPLTVWEVNLRKLAGQPVSEATFIGRLLHYLLFVAVPGWMAQVIYIACALVILLTFVLAPPRRRRGNQSA